MAYGDPFWKEQTTVPSIHARAILAAQFPTIGSPYLPLWGKYCGSIQGIVLRVWGTGAEVGVSQTDLVVDFFLSGAGIIWLRLEDGMRLELRGW